MNNLEDILNAGYGAWKNTVPLPARLYLQTMFGDRSQPFTEKDLSQRELDGLKQQIEISHARRKGIADDKAHAAQHYLKFADDLDRTHPELSAASQKDHDWAQLSLMQHLHDAGKLSPEEYDHMSDLKGRLMSKYKDQFPQLPNYLISGVLGKNPKEIKTTLDKEKEHFLGDGQGQAIRKQIEESAKAKDVYKTRGWVDYGDYSQHDTPPLDYRALGRFTYEKNPQGGMKVKDNYDFDNDVRHKTVLSYESMNPFERFAKAATIGAADSEFPNPQSIGGPGPIPSIPSEFGMAYIGRNGRDVDINLPKGDWIDTLLKKD